MLIGYGALSMCGSIVATYICVSLTHHSDQGGKMAAWQICILFSIRTHAVLSQ